MNENTLTTRIALLEENVERLNKQAATDKTNKDSAVMMLIKWLGAGLIGSVLWIAALVISRVGLGV